MAQEPTSRQDIQGDYNPSTQGGGDATVNVTNYYASPAGSVSSAYRGILGLPPLTDRRTIEQRSPLVERLYATLRQPEVNALVLTGIGGVGKSTLAALLYHFAHHQLGTSTSPFAAPPLWLSVDRSTTFADVVGTLFHALSKPIPELGSLSPANQAAVLFSLLDTAEASRLVVLDQFENLLDGMTGFALLTKVGVGEWLDALNGQLWTGSCRLILTSRPRPKGTRAYPPTYLQDYPVEGLSLSEGLDLLRKRGVQAPEAELRRAVSACNGHALSLTLLIALVQEYGMHLAELLTEPTLWVGDIATNLLDAVFGQLNEVQRAVLRAYSVYRIPIPVQAISPLLDTSSATKVQRAILALLTQHLIQRIEEDRYQLHAIVASYASQHFVEGDEQANRQALQAAHTKAAHFYLQYAQIHCPPRKHRSRVSDVQPFIEAVWHHAQAGQWQAAYSVVEQEGLFESLSQWGGNVLLFELGLLLLPRAEWQPERAQEATINLSLGRASDVLGKKQEALDYFQQALTIFREVGDRRGKGMTLSNLGSVYDNLGKKQEALDYFQQALTINREVGDRGNEGTTLSNLGLVYNSLGKKQEALDFYQQALTISREVGDRAGEGTALDNLGSVYNSLGKKQEALDYFQQALTISREVGDRRGEGTTLNNLGLVYDDLGKKQEALDFYQQALTISREVGDRGGEGTTLGNLGSVYDDLGKKQEALDFYQQALTIFREVGDRGNEGTTLSNLGSVYDDLGKKQEALDFYQQALTISREVGDRGGEGEMLFNIGASLFQQQHDVSLAALLLAHDIFDEVQSPNLNDVLSWIVSLHDVIGEQQFAALVARVEPHVQQIIEQFLRQNRDEEDTAKVR